MENRRFESNEAEREEERLELWLAHPGLRDEFDAGEHEDAKIGFQPRTVKNKGKTGVFAGLLHTVRSVVTGH